MPQKVVTLGQLTVACLKSCLFYIFFSQVVCVRLLQLGEENACMMIQNKSEGKLG